MLESLQRRASLSNPGDRDALLAHPDAIVLPIEHIAEGNVFIAEGDGTVVGTFDSSGTVGTGASQKLPTGAKYAAVLYQDAAGNWGHLASTKLGG